MKNIELARIFYEIAEILEMQNVDWKPGAYRKAARGLEGMKDDVQDLVDKGLKEVEKIPGVGEGIGKKIIEYCKTGKIKVYEQLKKKVPGHLEDLLRVPGMGPKKAMVLYQKLKIDSLKKLEMAAKKGKIRKLKGFGQKSENDFLRGLELLKLSKGRVLLGFVYPIAQELKERLKDLKEVSKVEVAGSIRRMKETVKDIDILVVSKKPKTVMDFFCKMPEVKVVLAKGNTKSSIVLRSGINIDLRVVEAKSWGAALNYFTGSKDHNIKLRQIAIKKGYKLSEYGLFSRKTGKFVVGRTEEELYAKLGLKYIPAEMRENTGEVSLKSIPMLVTLKDIKGDLHMHTTASDGDNSLKEMVEAAKKKGYKYICVTDHSPAVPLVHGLSERDVLKRIKEVKKFKGIKVLVGAEVDVLKDGSLDYSDSLLKKLDIVIASVHSGFKNSRKQVMARYEKVMKNPYVHIIGHPTGRLLLTREGLNVDIDKLIQLAKKYGKVLEVNSQPARFDLCDDHIKKVIDAGVKIVINTDSHATNQLDNMMFGVGTARRGWARKKDVINTYSLKNLMRLLK